MMCVDLKTVLVDWFVSEGVKVVQAIFPQAITHTNYYKFDMCLLFLPQYFATQNMLYQSKAYIYEWLWKKMKMQSKNWKNIFTY